NHLKKKHQNQNFNEQIQPNIPIVNKSVIDLKRHILVKFNKMQTKMGLYAMVRLANFFKSSFGPFYKNKKWKIMYAAHVINNTKKFPLKNVYECRRFLVQSFKIDLDTRNIPESIIGKLKLPKKIQIPVKKFLIEKFTTNIKSDR
ncbi:hypothetical protein BpHYR1_015044, partial [Brachionus plicatilis]